MNVEQFSDLVRQHKGLIYHVSYTMLHGHADYLDAVQEALTTAWAKRETLRNEEAFKAWLARILVNTCNGMLRKQKRAPLTLLESMAAPDSEATGIDEAICSLPDDLRVPVVMYYIEGFSVLQIAEMLDAPEGTIKHRLYRARQRLKKFLTMEEVI